MTLRSVATALVEITLLLVLVWVFASVLMDVRHGWGHLDDPLPWEEDEAAGHGEVPW